jgi:hypothetical protein
MVMQVWHSVQELLRLILNGLIFPNVVVMSPIGQKPVQCSITPRLREKNTIEAMPVTPNRIPTVAAAARGIPDLRNRSEQITIRARIPRRIKKGC